MTVTIHDVAKRAGVGIGTVSSVINDSRPVNERTRQRVLDAIEALDFVPNTTGRRLSMGKTHTIGVVIPFFTSPAQMERLRGVVSVINQTDYEMSLFAVENAEQREKIFRILPKRGLIDGLLIISLPLTDDETTRLIRLDIPTVLLEARHPELHSIHMDDRQAVYRITQHIINLGHRRIAYLSERLDSQFSTYSHNRFNGFKDALHANRLPFDKRLQVKEGPPTRASGYRLALELLQQPHRPTAIVAYCDLIALGAMEAARELGIKIPQGLSVVGYDDVETAQFARLTTIHQHLIESGRKGMELLLEVIANPNSNVKHIEFTPELIIRNTTAPPPEFQPKPESTVIPATITV